jgi:EAL domain-containing protein (putative c-di-GMP-specific phosphodiesterase class I)
VIKMAHSVNLRVVAEGVEQAEELAFLREHRCDEAQGYYFSRPVPAAQLEACSCRASPNAPGTIPAAIHVARVAA